MSNIGNTWVRYVDRSYQQIKTSVLTNLQALVPEMTDHTESNIFVKMIGVWSGMVEMLGYYIDNAAREAHLSTARLYWSGVKIAKSYDYRVHSHLASSGDVTFYLDVPAPSPILIPLGTEIESEDGLVYHTVQSVTIPIGATEVVVSARQYTFVATTVLGTSDGSGGQTFVIEDDVVDGSVVLKVGGLAWAGQVTLGYSSPTDIHYVQAVNEDKQVYVYFGDDMCGAIPPAGSAIEVEYQRTSGEEGNTGAYTITTINSAILLPSGVSIGVENRVRTSGGSGVESLEQLQRRVPKSIRTLLRAVTEQDFIDVAELYTGVAKAGVSYNCGKNVNIYIVPDGGGIASNILLSSTEAWFEDFRIVTTNVKVYPAGEIRIRLNITVAVLPQYTNAAVVADLKARLVNFLSFQNQEIGGKVELSDIYEVIENTDGVNFSNIDTMLPVPYARPTGVTTNPLNWIPNIQAASTIPTRWEIKLVGGSIYELLKDGAFLGIFTVGVLVSQPEVAFTVVASSYSIGDSWEFYTYPAYGTIDIIEPSLPVSIPSDITINASGGL